jgi:hypothetical protein
MDQEAEWPPDAAWTTYRKKSNKHGKANAHIHVVTNMKVALPTLFFKHRYRVVHIWLKCQHI